VSFRCTYTSGHRRRERRCRYLNDQLFAISRPPTSPRPITRSRRPPPPTCAPATTLSRRPSSTNAPRPHCTLLPKRRSPSQSRRRTSRRGLFQSSATPSMARPQYTQQEALDQAGMVHEEKIQNPMHADAGPHQPRTPPPLNNRLPPRMGEFSHRDGHHAVRQNW
jgi:hypothetical protein